MIGADNLSHLHLGADEIFNYATCKECKLFVNQAGHSALFTRWIKKVIKNVKSHYPRLALLAWDDMFRYWSMMELMTLKINQQH